ncbi:endonuclease III related protein [Mariprofundus micogutta]|uniref:Endonuclease III related protein n=1 Tax=Mariprofundus micogutta TaxID=1921010 RepID=A0A1L8CJJ0_9PROT|nr:endonuclease III domain-containing protein [Mariprofundus micogutta]GAV19087.1 endonuclease III related protein [Mariprofundus micogutta]
MRLAPLQIYETLLAAYGPQHWWPADKPFEVMVGAILTQNTNWQNVEKAITSLKTHDMLDCESIATCNLPQLGEIIRSSGSYMQKARYLQQFSLFYFNNGKRKGLKKLPVSLLRPRLLSVHGIGPETADSILLYALDQPVFVIDAYTKRLFVRLEHFGHELGYDSIQHYFQQRLPESLPLFQEFHALIVEHAKRHCRTKPLCQDCPLFDRCPTASCSTIEIHRSLVPDVD